MKTTTSCSHPTTEARWLSRSGVVIKKPRTKLCWLCGGEFLDGRYREVEVDGHLRELHIGCSRDSDRIFEGKWYANGSDGWEGDEKECLDDWDDHAWSNGEIDYEEAACVLEKEWLRMVGLD